MLVVCCFIFSACMGPRTLSTKPMDADDEFYKKPTVRFTKVSPGDTIKIIVYNEKDFSGNFKVPVDGKISIPIIGRFQVSGKTTEKLEKELITVLSKNYLKEPQVVVYLEDSFSQQIFITGAVKEPGAIEYKPNMTLIQALSLVGGVTDRADPNLTTVTRDNQESLKDSQRIVRVSDITYGEAQDVYLRPGDIIYVPLSVF